MKSTLGSVVGLAMFISLSQIIHNLFHSILRLSFFYSFSISQATFVSLSITRMFLLFKVIMLILQKLVCPLNLLSSSKWQKHLRADYLWMNSGFAFIWKESEYYFKRIIQLTKYFSANTVQRAGPWEEVQDYPDRTFDLDNCLCFCNLWVGQHYWASRVQKCMYALIHACIPFEWWPLKSRLFGWICDP